MTKGRRQLDQPQTTAKIIAWLVAGRAPTEIALELNVKRQSVYGFIKRHKAELAELQARAVVAAHTVAIGDKLERLRRLQYLVDKTHDVLETRGIIASEAKWIGGEFGREVTVERYDAGLVRSYGALLLQAAQELGELPKPSGVDAAPPQITQVNVQVNIDQRKEQRASHRDRIIDA